MKIQAEDLLTNLNAPHSIDFIKPNGWILSINVYILIAYINIKGNISHVRLIYHSFYIVQNHQQHSTFEKYQVKILKSRNFYDQGKKLLHLISIKYKIESNFGQLTFLVCTE